MTEEPRRIARVTVEVEYDDGKVPGFAKYVFLGGVIPTTLAIETTAGFPKAELGHFSFIIDHHPASTFMGPHEL